MHSVSLSAFNSSSELFASASTYAVEYIKSPCNFVNICQYVKRYRFQDVLGDKNFSSKDEISHLAEERALTLSPPYVRNTYVDTCVYVLWFTYNFVRTNVRRIQCKCLHKFTKIALSQACQDTQDTIMLTPLKPNFQLTLATEEWRMEAKEEWKNIKFNTPPTINIIIVSGIGILMVKLKR